MNKRIKKILFYIAIIILLILLQWGYYLPLQEYLCRKAYTEYIMRQGILEEDILYAEMSSIPNVDGWQVKARYKKDSENEYNYCYFLHAESGTKMKIGRMSLVVIGSDGKDVSNKCLYPPLHHDGKDE